MGADESRRRTTAIDATARDDKDEQGFATDSPCAWHRRGEGGRRERATAQRRHGTRHRHH
jgi:hypothetical protein